MSSMRVSALVLFPLLLLPGVTVRAADPVQQRVTVFFGFRTESSLEKESAKDPGLPVTFDWRQARDLAATTYGLSPDDLKLVSISTGFDLAAVTASPEGGTYSLRLCDDRKGERAVVLDAAVPAQEGRILFVPIDRRSEHYLLVVATALQPAQDFSAFQRDARAILRERGAVPPGVPLTRDAFPCPPGAS